MSQSSQPFCPQCGTSVPPGQRFCSNCGASTDPGFSKPTAMASGEHIPQVPQQPAEYSTPPPPPASSYSQPAQPTPAPPTYYAPQQGQSFPPQQGQNFAPQQSYQPAPVPVPDYAKPQKDSSKSVLGQMGCGVLIVILIIVGICGGASFFAYRFLTSAASSTTTSTTNSTTNTTTTGNSTGTGTPQAVPATTTQMNATVTYASVDVTFVNAQKASSFTDDTGLSNASIVVRLNIKEHNPTTDAVFLFYGDNFHLILPDGSSVAAGSEQTNGDVGQAVTRNNWVDFPLTADVDVSKLTLRIGAANEAQMDIPLTTSPDVSKYQLKTITPNSAFNYAGLNWTLTTVTSGLSADGKQATTGMRYIVVTLKADNHTQNLFYLFAGDDARLQAGSTTSPPTSNTFNSIAAGTTGTTGTITFLMPQSATSFTLLLLARSDTTPPATQVTNNFQI
jgi:hypothetical protein